MYVRMHLYAFRGAVSNDHEAAHVRVVVALIMQMSQHTFAHLAYANAWPSYIDGIKLCPCGYIRPDELEVGCSQDW